MCVCVGVGAGVVCVCVCMDVCVCVVCGHAQTCSTPGNAAKSILCVAFVYLLQLNKDNHCNLKCSKYMTAIPMHQHNLLGILQRI